MFMTYPILLRLLLQNSVIDVTYSMLLGRPWSRYAKITYDRENNTMTIQGNGIVQTIVVNDVSK
jgi:hypothetical protein